VTASFEGQVPSELVTQLKALGINTSSQTRIDAVLDYDEKGVDGALRMSPHYYNDHSDLDALMAGLETILSS
jgi:selenocysteine lyase/cysteine desulfurase